jgi:hypothetical protein
MIKGYWHLYQFDIEPFQGSESLSLFYHGFHPWLFTFNPIGLLAQSKNTIGLISIAPYEIRGVRIQDERNSE